jgi:hypothetical protein
VRLHWPASELSVNVTSHGSRLPLSVVFRGEMVSPSKSKLPLGPSKCTCSGAVGLNPWPLKNISSFTTAARSSETEQVPVVS